MKKTTKKTRQPRATVAIEPSMPGLLNSIAKSQEMTLATLARIEASLKQPADATPSTNVAVTAPLDVEQVFGRIASSLEGIGTTLQALAKLPVGPIAAPAESAPKAPRAKKEPAAPKAEQPRVEPQVGVTHGDCADCGTQLTRDNTSTSPSGRITHIGCPGGKKAEEKPVETQVVAESKTASGRTLRVVEEKPAEPEKKPEVKPEPKKEEPAAVPTFDDLRAAALAFLDKNGGGGKDAKDEDKAKAKAALAKTIADHGGGAAKLSDIVDDKKAAVLAALKA